MAAEQSRRQLRPCRALTDPDAALLPEHDAQRLGRLSEDGLLGRQQTPRGREAIERRCAHHRSRGHAEDAAEVDERPQGGLFEAEDCLLLAGVFDDGVLEERQGRQAGETVVREHLHDVAVDRLGGVRADRVPQRARAVERTQVEERSAPRHAFDDRILNPAAIPPTPLGGAGHVERRFERGVGVPDVVARGQALDDARVALECFHAVRAVVVDQHHRGSACDRLAAAGRSAHAPAAGHVGQPCQRENARQDGEVGKLGEPCNPFGGRRARQVLKRAGASPPVERAQGLHVGGATDVPQDACRLIAERRRRDRAP